MSVVGKMDVSVHFLSFLFLLGIQHNKAEEVKCVKTCPRNWERKMDYCYWFSSIQRNWGGAREYCKKEDGHLASITNSTIHDFIQSKVDPNCHETWFWVGGTDQERENDWRWTDESQWEFTKWARRQPDNHLKLNLEREHCLQIWKTGWNDQSCGHSLRFVCSQKICPLNDNGDQTINGENNSSRPTDADTTKETNATNNTSDLPIKEVAIPSGVFLIVSIIVIITCVIRKRPEKKQETMNADLNPVYGVYELTETYERQYSTNEAVDNNYYYG